MNFFFQVEKAVRAVKVILFESTQAALENEARSQSIGRYSVI